MDAKLKKSVDTVRKAIESEAQNLGRGDYREFLDEIRGIVSSYIDCWDEEEN